MTPAAPALPGSLDEARSYLSCVVGLPPGGRAAWQEVVRRLGRRKKSLSGADAGLYGRGLSFLEDPRALAALDRAVAGGAPAAALTWRAEARLLRGQQRLALDDLAAASKLAPDSPWPALLMGVCLLSLGDCEAARRRLEPLTRRPRAAQAALGLLALSEGQSGRPRDGIRRLDEALRAAPSAFLLCVRGLLRRDAGELAASLEDFTAAARLEPSAWTLLQRAEALNRVGFYKEALDELARAAREAPRSSQPHLQAANIYFDQAFYPEALRELDRGIDKQPREPALWARRGRIHFVVNALPRAEADLARARALAEDSQLLLEQLQIKILRGQAGAVLRALPRSRLPEAFVLYLKAYADCRARRYEEARQGFLRAAALSDGPFAQRLRFFAQTARVLGEAPVKRSSAPAGTQLFLCGIGIHHPYQATVEIIQTLGRCEVIYNNLGDPQVSDFLGLFGGEIRAVRRVAGEPAMGRVERMIGELDRARPTAFVTRIHPYMYRRIANDLVTVCRREGLRFHAFGAVSLTEVSWALGDDAAGRAGPRGLRVFDIYFLVREPALLRVDVGTVIYCIGASDVRRQLCALLSRRLRSDHVVYILAGSGDREQQVEPVSVAALEPRLLAVDLGAVLYVPAAGGPS